MAQYRLAPLDCVRKARSERINVKFAEVGGDLHGQYQYFGPGGFRITNHSGEIVSQLANGVSAQSVIPAELDDHNVWLISL